MRFFKSFYLIAFLFSISVFACSSPQMQVQNLNINLTVDAETLSIEVPSGSTARDAFEIAGITINILDEADPPFYTILKDTDTVILARIIEEFSIQEQVIPYGSQDLRNESLPEGEIRLIQPGENGIQEITYRQIFRDGVEVSKTIVKTIVVEAPVSEVVMVGSQAPFVVIPIDGKLAYISAGNAWVMEENTGYRRPVITSGDLDGFIFELSPDGEWLLFTRTNELEDQINELWVVKIGDESSIEIDLKVENIIHFADWLSGPGFGVIYSTVDPTFTSPGWQANNDLNIVNFNVAGWVSPPKVVLKENSGGMYGWWGTSFELSPDKEELIYSRPDGVGFVDIEQGIIEPLYDVVPFQTGSDWAWVPEVSWSPDGDYLYLVSHAPQEGLSSHEESALFDLTVVPLIVGPPINIVHGVGMFSNPQISPIYSGNFEDDSYKIAFLKALVSTQSRNSGYRMFMMDRDGSNQKQVFPPEGAPGLVPQKLVWAPLIDKEYNFQVALTYQGNLWLIDMLTGLSRQLTGDGLTGAIDWK